MKGPGEVVPDDFPRFGRLQRILDFARDGDIKLLKNLCAEITPVSASQRLMMMAEALSWRSPALKS